MLTKMSATIADKTEPSPISYPSSEGSLDGAWFTEGQSRRFSQRPVPKEAYQARFGKSMDEPSRGFPYEEWSDL